MPPGGGIDIGEKIFDSYCSRTIAADGNCRIAITIENDIICGAGSGNINRI